MADTKKSSSLEQQMAEDEIFCMVEDWLGCKVSRNPKIKMNNNDKVHIEPDFYSEEHSIIGEIFAHIGENKRGQSTKIANDILKMLLIEKDRCKSYRKIIVVWDEQEEALKDLAREGSGLTTYNNDTLKDLGEKYGIGKVEKIIYMT